MADTANGMGGLVRPAGDERLPMTLVHLYPELDGTFPNHPADPIEPENRRDLTRTSASVARTSASRSTATPIGCSWWTSAPRA